MTPTPQQRDEQQAPTTDRGDDAGQVSEVSTLEGADEPIQPDQSVAGSPDDEPGSVDEGSQGPNANPNQGASRT